MTEEKTGGSKKWVDDAEQALNKASEALKAAWDGTREARMSTLEAAKEAAAQLGQALDKAIEAARESWDSSPRTDTPEETNTTPEETDSDS
jgi:hypothetical protein